MLLGYGGKGVKTQSCSESHKSYDGVFVIYAHSVSQHCEYVHSAIPSLSVCLSVLLRIRFVSRNDNQCDVRIIFYPGLSVPPAIHNSLCNQLKQHLMMDH